jgi:hypothetical protein
MVFGERSRTHSKSCTPLMSGILWSARITSTLLWGGISRLCRKDFKFLAQERGERLFGDAAPPLIRLA